MAKALDRMRFGPNYSERARLEEGTEITLRLIRRSDGEKLLAGFAALSAQSRYLRFLTEHSTLSERELEFLTDVDQVNHFCIGALLMGADGGEGEGIGVARFVREPERPEVAEAAVTVVDAWQRKGLGKILLVRLAEAARERGVRIFRTTLHASNEPVRRLLKGLGSEIEIAGRGEVVTCEMAVPERRAILEELAPWRVMRAFLRIVAGPARD